MSKLSPPRVAIPWSPTELDRLISKAFEEDLTGGDITSDAIFSPGQEVQARAVAKQDLVVCGLPVARRVFSMLEPKISWEELVQEGQVVSPGDVLFRVRGPVGAVLSAERTALNLLQHMSGIATMAKDFSAAVSGLSVRVVDTRKTLPGLRAFQCYAVRVGGCFNHRYNLGSGVLLKENHIRAAGSIASAVKATRNYAPHLLKVEIEVTNLEELKEALDAGADVVMLDNMSPAEMKQARELTGGRAILEASGGVTLETVREIAESGVDVISVGALTHSVKAADISLLVELQETPARQEAPGKDRQISKHKDSLPAFEDFEEDELLPFVVELSPSLYEALEIQKGEDSERSELEADIFPKMCKAFFADRGIRIPEPVIRENDALGAGRFSCFLQGDLIGTGELQHDRLLCVLPPQELEIFQVEAQKTRHPITQRDASWIDRKHNEKMKEARIQTWAPSRVLVLELLAFLERHAYLLVDIEQTQSFLAVVEKKAPALVALVKQRFSLVLLRRVLRVLARDTFSLRYARRILEALLDADPANESPEALADEVRATLSRILCQEFAVRETQLLVYMVAPDLEVLLSHLFLEQPLPEHLTLPEEPKDWLYTLYEELREHFRSLPSSASSPLLLVRDRALRRPLQHVLQRAFPSCGVIAQHELHPDFAVMVIEALDAELLLTSPR